MSIKIFYLKSCSTCVRILKSLDINANMELREIKTNPITETEIDDLAARIGSYEALFSRKSQKYRTLGLHEKNLSEQDYRSLILSEYTFLKRPVFLIGRKVFAGNAAETVEAVKIAISDSHE
jgi:arsenate reductase (glutaredoxin)